MPPRRLLALPALVLGGVGLTGCGAAGDPPTVSPGGVDMLQVPTPSPDPDDFVARVDNPWLPLLPGAEWVYESTDGETITVTVTDRTREVAGVTTTVVRDVVTDEEGEVVEETDDWFAQDRAGNVWYFGEDTVEYDDRGRPDRAGSWEAGVDGAQAGVVMLARPRRGDGYQQEYAAGEAEDRATVLALDEARAVGSESYTDLLLVEDTTPLEPGLVEHKYYARGTGLVFEETVSGGNGEAELVEFTPGEAAR
ncbi:hypothetical protein [Nocardioides sp. GXQ0305]|uniref:hypothetical protein n=1 Tax=Nocardioides sp. GXQ0305 TaxID=3423912 RepID=UPI003D7D1034